MFITPKCLHQTNSHPHCSALHPYHCHVIKPYRVTRFSTSPIRLNFAALRPKQPKITYQKSLHELTLQNNLRPLGWCMHICQITSRIHVSSLAGRVKFMQWQRNGVFKTYFWANSNVNHIYFLLSVCSKAEEWRGTFSLISHRFCRFVPTFGPKITCLHVMHILPLLLETREMRAIRRQRTHTPNYMGATRHS